MPAMLAASLLLTTPRIWFVIEEGWTEPIGIFLLALTVVLMERMPIAARLGGRHFRDDQAVSRRHSPSRFVRLMFMRPRQWPWIAFGMVFAAAAVTLPFALWHPNAFMRNVVWLQTPSRFASTR